MNVDLLLDEIKIVKDSKRRNEIALYLSDIKCNEAVPVIIDLIKKLQYTNNIGTLIYSLDNLDCENYLFDILNILFHGNWEASNTLLTIFKNKYNLMNNESKEKCLQKFIAERKRAEDIIDMIDDVCENII